MRLSHYRITFAAPLLYVLVWILEPEAVPLLLRLLWTSCSYYQMVVVVLVAVVAADLVA